LLIADGTNFNPTAVTALSEISTVANDDVFLAIDTSGGGLKKIARSAVVAGLATSSAISNLVDDDSPQLGADLDTNSFNIAFDDAHGINDDSGNEFIIFQKTATAVNQLDITNAATGNPPEVSATGSDSNISLKLTPKGTGQVVLDGNVGIESGLIDLKNSGSVSSIRFYCESSNAHYAAINAPAHSDFSGNVTLTLPATTSSLVGDTATQTLTNKTLTSPVLNTGVSGTAVLDEDNLASNSATKLATQQSIKAYVDNSMVSLLATDIKIGEDDETKIDFETADEIHFYAANVEQVYLADNIFGPQTDSDVDLGTTGVRWKDAYVDSVTVTDNATIGGNLTVNGTTITVNSTTVTIDDPIFTLGGDTAPGTDDNKDRGIEFRYHTGSAAKVGFFGYDDSTSAFTFIPDATNSSEVFSGTAGDVAFGNIAGTLTTAAQTNVTSVGALDGGSISSGFGNIDTGSSTITTTGLISGGSLDIDNVLINGTTIGHTDDTDLMTLADGVLTVAGEVSMTTLDIGGTNVTATAAELNYTDGVTSNIQTQLDARASTGKAIAMSMVFG